MDRLEQQIETLSQRLEQVSTEAETAKADFQQVLWDMQKQLDSNQKEVSHSRLVDARILIICSSQIKSLKQEIEYLKADRFTYETDAMSEGVAPSAGPEPRASEGREVDGGSSEGVSPSISDLEQALSDAGHPLRSFFFWRPEQRLHPWESNDIAGGCLPWSAADLMEQEGVMEHLAQYPIEELCRLLQPRIRNRKKPQPCIHARYKHSPSKWNSRGLACELCRTEGGACCVVCVEGRHIVLSLQR